MKTFGSGETSPDDIRNWKTTILLVMGIGVIVAPAIVLVVALMWILVSHVRVNPKIIYLSYFVFAALFIVTGLLRYALQLIVENTTSLVTNAIDGFTVSSFVMDLLTFYLSQIPLALLIGGAIGCGYIAFRMFFRDKWTALEFRSTPLQYFRKKKHISQIQEDKDSPHSGRTLGVEKYGDKVIQSENEARAHTLVLGASGTGKALEINTPILTSTGYKPIKDIIPGDMVFNEHMKLVETLGAFDIEYNKPAYIFDFSNGESITTDVEHLWTISTGETVTTQDIVTRMRAGEKYLS